MRRHSPSSGLLLVALVGSACNEGHIDPSDAAVLEVHHDVVGDGIGAEVVAGSGLYVERASASPTGVEARVCWQGEPGLDEGSVVATFGEIRAAPVFDG